MVKSAFGILAVAVVTGIVLSPGIASAATAGPAVLAHSSSPSTGGPTGGSAGTTVTFTVPSGDLSITAPASVTLGASPGSGTGTGAPGTVITGNLGGVVTVTDDRALLAAAWTVTAASSDWTTGTTPTLAQTIPATDASYTPGTLTPSGGITLTGFTLAPTTGSLTNAAQTVVTGTAGVGDNAATWDPTIAVAIPAEAVTGLYTATLTQSVS